MNAKILFKSIMQGLVVFAASFGTYYYMILQDEANAPVSRSMGLAVLMLANLFLVQVNSSDIDSIITTTKNLAKDKIMWAVNIITLSGLAIILYTPLNTFLKLAPLSIGQFLIVLGLAAASVLWYEIVKLIKRVQISNNNKTINR